MTTFKVGDRVRIVGTEDMTMAHWVGTEDVIVARCDCSNPGCDAWRLAIATHCCEGIRCAWNPEHLAPLSKPKGLSVEEEIARLFERTDLVDFKARAKEPV